MNWEIKIDLKLTGLHLNVDMKSSSPFAALIGPNGAGKTTVLRCVAGILRPDSGKISIGERVLFDSDSGINLPPEHRKIGFLPQGFALFPHLSAVDNVAFGLLDTASKENARKDALSLLEDMGCADLSDRKPSSLSGGEAQKVALARALIRKPDLLLLDEPLSAMDVSARRKLRVELFKNLKKTRCPALIVSHDLKDIEKETWIHVIENGKLAQFGTKDELKTNPATEFVSDYLRFFNK